ncbi:MAG: glycosyltransferase [Bacilli bacterium]|nr:glycosyltransferase [Bacilli bacterium]
MLEKRLDIIYNKRYIVIVPSMSIDLLEGFSYTFGNTILMNNNIDDTEFMIKFINKNNFQKIIFVNYQVEYETLMRGLNRNYHYDFIFTESLASLSDDFIYNVYKNIFKLYKERKDATLGILDVGLYECLKNNKENVKRIVIDIPIEKGNENIDENTVGILNNELETKHSFYNELSAIKLIDNATVNLPKFNKVTKNFLKTFNIKHNRFKTKEDVLKNSYINLYINFTSNNNLWFLKSMDKSIPCILGNDEILDEYEYLKDNLIMNSDDDINEIASRVQKVKKNKKRIIDEYQVFRKDYSKKSKKTTEDFLGIKVEENDEEYNQSTLISVIVPVYNTSKYLEKSLDSILKAKVDNMEILIINDGSTDNSEEIILNYERNYPNLIRYIKQDNHGLGNVRNVGLKEAKGKYIASIDSDDTINSNFFKSALPYLEKNIDIVIYDWLTVTNDSTYQTAAIDYIFYNDNWNNYEGLLYTTIMPSTCNKIIKKELFSNLDIQYIEDKYEDLSTNPFILLKAETIKYINKQYYEYYIRSNSIMRTKPGYSMIDILKVVDDRLKKYQDIINLDINTFKYYTYSWRIEEYIINQLYTIDEEEIDSFIEYIYKNIKDIILEVFNNDKYKDTINQLDKKDKKYIEDRNKAIQTNTLEQFIKISRKSNNYFKLTPPIIYYGYKKDK